jgi:hypothetical protein
LKIKLEEIFPGKEIEETGIRSEKENNASSSTILSFFSAQLTRLSSFFLFANHVFFLPHFKGNNWCLMVPAMEGQKGVAPSSNLERNR